MITRFHRAVRCRATVLAIIVLGAAAWAGRVAFFEFVGSRWVVDNTPTAADAIVVLGGNTGRGERAAELYRGGHAPLVLVMPHDYGDSRSVLIARGVPAKSIVTLAEVRNTRDEALATRTWAEQSGARRFLVVTDHTHTRRALWIFKQLLSPPGFEVRATAVYSPGNDPNSWWRTPVGRSQLWSEWTKYIGYRLGLGQSSLGNHRIAPW